MAGSQSERRVADAVDGGLAEAGFEGDGPVHLAGGQRGQRGSRQSGGDIGGAVGVQSGGVVELAGDLFGRGAAGDHADAGALEGTHRALPVTLVAVDRAEVLTDDDVEEVLVLDLLEQHHVEAGVADAQHVVGGVDGEVDLAGNQRRRIRRTGGTLDELAGHAAVCQEALLHGNLRGQPVERGRLADTDLGRFRHQLLRHDGLDVRTDRELLELLGLGQDAATDRVVDVVADPDRVEFAGDGVAADVVVQHVPSHVGFEPEEVDQVRQQLVAVGRVAHPLDGFRHCLAVVQDDVGVVVPVLPGREQYCRGPVQLGRAVSRLESERPIADVVEFGQGQTRLERDGPVDLVGQQRGQCRTRQASRDVRGVVGIKPGRVEQLPSNLLSGRAAGHHADVGAVERGHRALPIALDTVDLTEVVRHHDVEEMGVDDLGEHDHIELGVAETQHVVRSVQCDIDLIRHQRRGLGRTRQARHELDVGPPIGKEPVPIHDLRIHLGERRRCTHPHRVHLRRTDRHRLDAGISGVVHVVGVGGRGGLGVVHVVVGGVVHVLGVVHVVGGGVVHVVHVVGVVGSRGRCRAIIGRRSVVVAPTCRSQQRQRQQDRENREEP